MGCLLTISKGLQQGRQYTFEQPELHIGRTPENDLVLQDTGVSRQHVRISERLGRYYAQDMGSSNGTRLNDAPLTGERELNDGDRLALGAAEFVFKEVVSDEDATRPMMTVSPVEDDDATRPIKTLRPVVAPPVAPVEDDDATRPIRRNPTGASLAAAAPSGPPVLLPVDKAPASGGAGGARRATMGQMPLPPPVPPAAAALARPEPRAPVLVDDEAPTTAPVRKSESAPASPGLSAADKARRRRELGGTLGGQFSLWWSELSGAGKGVLLALACCFVLGTGVVLKVVFRPSAGEQAATGPEPTVLGLQVLPDSFGLGNDVKWSQPDLKAFDFEFVSPTRAVVVVRYQASGISKDEVSVSVNAVPVGFIPADTLNAAEREVQQILSPAVLKRNERNQLVFDNVQNPPGRNGWRVWNLRLEIIPVPELPPEKLLETARDYVGQARAYYDQREVGAENLFRSWENFRSAWITLEALDEKPDLYQDVRYMLGQVAVDLDHKCGQLMLDFKRNIQFKDRKRAAAALANVKTHFPTAAHRCHNLAVEKANEYGL